MAYDAAHGYILLFGGITDLKGSTPFGDTWEFHGGCWKQVCTSCTSGTSEPSARYNARMAYDTADGYVVLYGGCNTLGGAVGSSIVCPSGGGKAGDYLSDAWKWTGTQWSNICTGCPPGIREMEGLAFDPSDNYLLLFGGDINNAYCGDTWKFVAGTFTELFHQSSDCTTTAGTVCTATTCPAVRSYSQVTHDSLDNEVLLFGGENGNGYLQDTWIYKSGAWSECTASTCTGTNEPPLTAFGVMAYDTTHSYCLLSGGYGGTALHSGFYWTFASNTWTNVTSAYPPALQSAAMSYDASSSDNYLVFFGGSAGNGEQATTWIFV